MNVLYYFKYLFNESDEVVTFWLFAISAKTIFAKQDDADIAYRLQAGPCTLACS